MWDHYKSNHKNSMIFTIHHPSHWKAHKNNIYKVFCYPTDKHINDIVETLFNDELTLTNSFKQIQTIIQSNQLLLKNIVNEVVLHINHSKRITDIERYLYVLDKMGDLEYYLTNDYNFKIQLYSLISIFKIKIYT